MHTCILKQATERNHKIQFHHLWSCNSRQKIRIPSVPAFNDVTFYVVAIWTWKPQPAKRFAVADFTISATGLIICLLFTKLRSELLLCTGPFTYCSWKVTCMVCWLCSHTKINLTFTHCISQEFQICAVMLSNTELWTRLHIYWLVAPLHVCRFTEMLKQNFAFRLEIKTFKCLLVSDVTTSGHESLFALFMSELIHGRDVWLDNVWCCPPLHWMLCLDAPWCFGDHESLCAQMEVHTTYVHK